MEDVMRQFESEGFAEMISSAVIQEGQWHAH